MNVNFFRSGVAALLMMFVVVFVSCAKEEAKIEAPMEVKIEAYVSFYAGNVTLVRAGVPVEVKIKEIVKDGDVVTVGDKSSLIMQWSDELVVRFEANTEAVVKSINDISNKEIILNKGKVLSSVEKLKKNDSYIVKTPTLVASVRGTRFLTEFTDKKAVVAVGKGTVSVTRQDNPKIEKDVDLGASAVVTKEKDGIEMRKVNKVETLELAKMERTPVVKDIENKTVEELKVIFAEPSKKDQELNSEIKEETGLTFEEMKEKYGRIDVLTLYNGKVVQGVIVTRGATYRVLTQDGPMAIKAKAVKHTDVK